MNARTEVEEEELPLEGAVVRDAEEDQDGDHRHVPRPELLLLDGMRVRLGSVCAYCGRAARMPPKC